MQGQTPVLERVKPTARSCRCHALGAEGMILSPVTCRDGYLGINGHQPGKSKAALSAPPAAAFLLRARITRLVHEVQNAPPAVLPGL